MSDYLRHPHQGDTLEVTGSHGVFFMRKEASPVILIAGGTGLGPMLSMLHTMAEVDSAVPSRSVKLLYGVNDESEIACLDTLNVLQKK